MPAYYNEHDPKAAAWLRELIGGGFIAPGYVDERSIADVSPHEIAGYDAQTWPKGWDGNEPGAWEVFENVFPDGSVQTAMLDILKSA